MRYRSEWLKFVALDDGQMTPEQVDRFLADIGVQWRMIDEDMHGDAIVMDFRLTSRDSQGRRITATLRGLEAGVLAPPVLGRDHPQHTFPNASWLLSQLPWYEQDQIFEAWLLDATGFAPPPRNSDSYRRHRASYTQTNRHYRTVSRFFAAIADRLESELPLWRCLQAAGAQ